MKTTHNSNRFYSGLRLELPYLVDALDCHHVFFHQPEQFRFLADMLEDHLRHHVQPPTNFLVVGCDRGIDAYSVGIVCLEATRAHPEFLASILATDFLPDNRLHAVRGIYHLHAVNSMPHELIKRYFLRSRDTERVRLRPGVRSRINFRCQDIFERFNLREPMDVIFCRQVLHHFETPLAHALAERMHHYLAPGGILFLGQDLAGLSGFGRIAPAIYQAK